MTSAKIIFLDVDGVLCTLRSHLAYHGRGGLWNEWDPAACAVLRRVCETGVQIVVSSTWRLNCAGPDDASSELHQQLVKHDLRRFLRLPNWRTPRLPWNPKQEGRGFEIAAYLAANPDVTDYRILDDDSDMLPEQEPKLIHTHGHDGISGRQMLDLLKWADLEAA